MNSLVARLLALSLGVLLIGGACSCASRDVENAESRLMIHAAASLEEAVRALGETYSRESGVELSYNFGGSSSVAQQIVKGGARGIFISADEAWANFVAEGSGAAWVPQDALWGNSLTVVASKNSEFAPVDDAKDLAGVPAQFWVLADPHSVPAGRYARTWTESVQLGSGQNLWNALSPKLAPAINVRAAVAQIRRVPGSVGIIYGSDFQVFGESLVEIYRPTLKQAPEIRYHAVCLGETEEALELYQGFLDYVRSVDAMDVLESYGFVPKPDMRH